MAQQKPSVTRQGVLEQITQLSGRDTLTRFGCNGSS